MLNYQQLQTLAEYAALYGNVFLSMALEALQNCAGYINCERPTNRSSITLPDGITRFGKDGGIEYCCRARLLPGFTGPNRNGNATITTEFNAVAVAYNIPQCFQVKLEPYPRDRRYVLIVAKPL